MVREPPEPAAASPRRDTTRHTSRASQARLEPWLVGLLALLAGLNALVWARTIPYDHAPDEFLHYAVPAFIADHGRLPVFGPTADAYVSTTPPEGSPYSAAYYSSYALFPGFSYLASAGLMRLAEALHPSAELLAARLPSVLSLPITVWLAYLCASTLRPPGNPVRLVVPACVASLPELTFVASYTNTDAATIAAATLTVFAWCYGARHRFEGRRAAILLGVAGGLVLLGKYTAYLVLPISALVVLTATRGWRTRLTAAATAGVVALAIAGWWFTRNALLYHDLFGFQVQAAAVQAVAPDFVPPAELTRDPLYLLTQTYWLPVTVESVFARFDYMSLWLPRPFVAVWTWLLELAAVVIGAWLGLGLVRLARGGWSVLERHRVRCGVYAALLLVVAGSVTEDVAYTLGSGNSPQGRYLLFASVPACLLACVAWDRLAGRVRLARWSMWLAPLFLTLANLWSLFEVLRPAYAG